MSSSRQLPFPHEPVSQPTPMYNALINRKWKIRKWCKRSSFLPGVRSLFNSLIRGYNRKLGESNLIENLNRVSVGFLWGYILSFIHNSCQVYFHITLPFIFCLVPLDCPLDPSVFATAFEEFPLNYNTIKCQYVLHWPVCLVHFT